MMLKDADDIVSNCHRLHRISQQISHHSHIPGMRKFYKNRQMGSVFPQRRMGWVPDALPTEDPAARFDFDPVGVEGMAAMAEPFGAELPSLAVTAALDHEPAFAQPRPVGRRQTVGFGDRNRQTVGKIARAPPARHSVASEPRMRLEAGVTIGPPITMATSLRFT